MLAAILRSRRWWQCIADNGGRLGNFCRQLVACISHTTLKHVKARGSRCVLDGFYPGLDSLNSRKIDLFTIIATLEMFERFIRADQPGGRTDAKPSSRGSSGRYCAPRTAAILIGVGALPFVSFLVRILSGSTSRLIVIEYHGAILPVSSPDCICNSPHM